MLYLILGMLRLICIQSLYAAEKKINRLVQFWNKKAEAVYLAAITKCNEEKGVFWLVKKPLYGGTFQISVSARLDFISYLKHKLNIVFGRVAKFIYNIEAEWIVGTVIGSKPMEVLIKENKL